METEKEKHSEERMALERKKMLRRKKDRKYRANMSIEKKEELRKKARERQRLSREKMRNENEEELRRLLREQKKRHRQNMTPEQLEISRKKNRIRFYARTHKVDLKTAESILFKGCEKPLQQKLPYKRRKYIIEDEPQITVNKEFESNEVFSDSQNINAVETTTLDQEELSGDTPSLDTPKSEKIQCMGCGLIMSSDTKLLEHIKKKHSQEFEFIIKLRDNVNIVHKHISLKNCDIIKTENSIEEKNISNNYTISDTEKAFIENIICKSLQGGKTICSRCGLILSCKELLELHTKIKHQDKHIKTEHIKENDDELVQCPVCDKNCTISDIYSHINTGHFLKNNKPFECEDCGLVFKSEKSLRQHFKGLRKKINSIIKLKSMFDFFYTNSEIKPSNHESEQGQQPNDTVNGSKGFKVYKCKLCDNLNKSSFVMLKHVLKTHVNLFECPLECPFCDFKTKRLDIKKHIKSMHPDVNTSFQFICEICGYMTLNKSTFKFHIRSHSTIYECEYCDYTTSLLTSINIHRRKHTKQKPYKCDFDGCQYRCSNKSSLTIHHFTHYPEKYLQSCDICGFRTVNKYTMNSHLKDHNKGQDLFSCIQCSYSTSIKTNFIGHSMVHKDVSQCTMCDFTTKYNQTMRKHMTTKHGIIHPGYKEYSGADIPSDIEQGDSQHRGSLTGHQKKNNRRKNV